MSVELIATLLMLLTFVTVGTRVVQAARKMNRQRRTAWSALADRRGWSFTEAPSRFSVIPSDLEVKGLVHGRRLSLRTETRGQGKQQYEVTLATLDLEAGVSGSLVTRPEGLGPALRNLLRMSHTDLSDADFETVVDAKRTTPEGHALLRDPRLRAHLLKLYHHCSHFSLVECRLEAERRGIPGSLEELEAFVTPVLELGEALDAELARTTGRARG